MTSESWGPLALALRDHAAGRPGVQVTVRVDGRETEHLATRHFFRPDGEIPEVEETALAHCRGRVLDGGAGAGAHALALQERGHDVVALDVSPVAVEIMRSRGVREARLGDLFRFGEGPFDTLLLLMNGIGVAGDLRGLDRLLVHAQTLIGEGGQVLFDSTDLRESIDSGEREAFARREAEGRYGGEVEFAFSYGGKEGAPFFWLFLDAETAFRHAAAAGWMGQVVMTGDEGTYLARLVRAG